MVSRTAAAAAGLNYHHQQQHPAGDAKPDVAAPKLKTVSWRHHDVAARQFTPDATGELFEKKAVGKVDDDDEIKEGRICPRARGAVFPSASCCLAFFSAIARARSKADTVDQAGAATGPSPSPSPPLPAPPPIPSAYSKIRWKMKSTTHSGTQGLRSAEICTG